jgi:hypothetical protein
VELWSNNWWCSWGEDLGCAWSFPGCPGAISGAAQERAGVDRSRDSAVLMALQDVMEDVYPLLWIPS